MRDDGYWLARLRRLQDQVQEHLDGVAEDGIGGTADYRLGYDSGRRVAYQRALLMIGGLRREWAAERAREAGGSAPGPVEASRAPRVISVGRNRQREP